MSSIVCQFSEGLGLPGFVQVADDPVDDPVHAGGVLEAAHWSGSASHLPKSPFYGVGGADLSPVGLGTAQEGHQFLQVSLQTGHRYGNQAPPGSGPGPEALHGFPTGGGLVDPLGLAQAGLLVLAGQLGCHIAELVGPAPLPRHVGIDRVQSPVQPWATVSGDQAQGPAPQPPVIEVPQEGLPLGLALGRGLAEADEISLSLGRDAVGTQHQAFLDPSGSL